LSPTGLDLDERLKRYWLAGKAHEDAEQVVKTSLASPPQSVKRAARALMVMDELETKLSGPLRDRVSEFRRHVERLRLRRLQVDLIGNRDSEPDAAVFEVLGEATEGAELADFDVNALHQARIGAARRADAAAQLLNEFGLDNVGEPDRSEILEAIDDMRDEQRHYKAQALFVDTTGQGFVLGLLVKPNDSRVWHTPSRIDPTMEKQAQVALQHALPQGAEWDIEWPFPVGGESIGLGLYLAALVATGELLPDSLCAATGKLEVDGQVRGVGGIAAKLEAAKGHGIRRVVLPTENQAEAENFGSDLELVFVDRASEIRPRVLRSSSVKAELGYEGRIRLARSLLGIYRLELYRESPLKNGYRLEVTDASSTAMIDVLKGKGATVVVGGEKNGSAYRAASQLVADHLRAAKPEKRDPHTYMIKSPPRRQRARQLLIEAGAVEQEAKAHEDWRLRLEEGAAAATIAQYGSGKCLVQGTAPAWDTAAGEVVKALEGLGGLDESGAPAKATTEELPEIPDEPRVGTDESGKGDYFGPLVSAAVFVTPPVAQQLKELGVADSKKLSDKRVRELAPQIKRLLGRNWKTTPLNPETYNRLQRQMHGEGKSLNSLLAWAHTRSLEDLLKRGAEPNFVIVDKFADASYIEGRLLELTRRRAMPILQFPKAERDMAVAAASILAREAFLLWLERASRELGRELPKGASDLVENAARELAAAQGRDGLGRYAKLHFKTTDKVLVA
jgi:ribonuclease HIII